MKKELKEAKRELENSFYMAKKAVDMDETVEWNKAERRIAKDIIRLEELKVKLKIERLKNVDDYINAANLAYRNLRRELSMNYDAMEDCDRVERRWDIDLFSKIKKLYRKLSPNIW
jgi:hypothetical protein